MPPDPVAREGALHEATKANEENANPVRTVRKEKRIGARIGQIARVHR
jgi:hypothetical protein